MSAEVSYVLVGDGGADRALIPIITWAIRRTSPKAVIPSPTFIVRAARSVDEVLTHVGKAYSPSLIFVHRDAEKMSYEDRRKEIPVRDRVVPVVPVRMTEAWLLIDEAAIRMASNNPRGTAALEMPNPAKLESLPDPKRVAHGLLTTASGLGARRRRSFRVERAVQRLSELIDDFSPLLGLPAFNAFCAELRGALTALHEA